MLKWQINFRWRQHDFPPQLDSNFHLFINNNLFIYLLLFFVVYFETRNSPWISRQQFHKISNKIVSIIPFMDPMPPLPNLLECATLYSSPNPLRLLISHHSFLFLSHWIAQLLATYLIHSNYLIKFRTNREKGLNTHKETQYLNLVLRHIYIK